MCYNWHWKTPKNRCQDSCSLEDHIHADKRGSHTLMLEGYT